MKLISIIIPCHNEEAVLPLFYERIKNIFGQLPAQIELVFVDDGSTDQTFSILKAMAESDASVHYISFTRNFGKEAAMLAGMRYTHGDYVSIMDADLQDPPELLLQMYEKIQSPDCDCVAARRSTRKGEPPIRSFFSHMFYRFFNKVSTISLEDGARDFRLMSRPMVDAVLSFSEHSRFSKGIFSYVGFHTIWLEYPNISRASGTSQWSFFALFRYALEGLFSFSSCFLYLPFLLSGLTFLLFIGTLIATIIGIGSGHFSSILAFSCLILLLFSFLFVSLGIIGFYLSRIFLEVKERPDYLVQETDLT